MLDHLKTKRGSYLLFLSVLLGLILWTSYLLYESYQESLNTVDHTPVNVRSGPGLTYDITGQLTVGAPYQLIREQNGWSLARYADGLGWLPNWIHESKENLQRVGMIGTVLPKRAAIFKGSQPTDRIAEVAKNDKLTILHTQKQWAQVQFEDKTGWIEQKYLDISQGTINNAWQETTPIKDTEEIKKFLAEYNFEVQATTEGVNIREAPKTDAPVVAKGKQNEKFAYLGQEGPFYHIRTVNGQEGYIANWLAKSNSQAMKKLAEKKQATTTLAQKTILLDPGHGGEDPGAINEDKGLYEKNVALKSTLALKEKLEEAGATVLLTRDHDETVSLDRRVEINNEQKPDLFISLHYDAAEQEVYSGSTVYYYHDSSIPLAKTVQDQLLETLPIPNNGIQFGDFQVIRESENLGLLLELGYMSNPNDVSKFNQETYHQKVAEAVYQALVIYFQ